jgi:hypothetical protein
MQFDNSVFTRIFLYYPVQSCDVRNLEKDNPTEYLKWLSSANAIPNRKMQELKDILKKKDKTMIYNTVQA